MRSAILLGGAVAVLAVLLTPPAIGQSTDQPDWIGLTLAEALERLRAKGLNLVYSSRLVRSDMQVDEKPAGVTPGQILESLLAPHGLTTREGAHGMLAIVPISRPPPQPMAIRGWVQTLDTGQPLTGAEVRIAETGVLVRTGRDGSFELTGVPLGALTIEADATGYLPVQHELVTVTESTGELTIELVPQPRFLRELVVTPSQYSLHSREAEPRQHLDRDQVQQLPHLSDDLFRVIHRLPGTAAGDFSATFGIRGGGRDEVMFILDGLQIYEPFHLRDFFHVLSIIDSEAVNEVELLTGGYPVEYGDRMSGVVNVTSTTPTGRRRSLGASTSNARFLVEGSSRVNDGDTTWLVSARQGYLDLLFDLMERADREIDFVTSPDFYDLFASLRRPVGERNMLTVSLLGSYDWMRFTGNDGSESIRGEESSWYLWANLDTQVTSSLTTRTMISATRIEHAISGFSINEGESHTETDGDRSLAVLGLKQDWTFEPSRRHLLRWGVDARRVSASYDYQSFNRIEDPLFIGVGPPVEREWHTILQPSGWQLSLYTSDRFQLGPRIIAEAGARWDRQTWTPGDDQLSPRLNLVWQLRKLGALRFAWGRYAQSQGIHELQVEDGVNHFFPAQWAEHRVVSFESPLTSEIDLRVEAYQKIMTDLRSRYENLFEPYEVLPAGEADRVRIAPDRAEARGIEVGLRGVHGDSWSWWASYALSSAEDLIDGVWQARSWDQRHTLSFSVNWQPRERWNLNLAGTFHSGWPLTPVYGMWQQLPDGGWIVSGELGQRNTARYPAYHRLDLRISRQLQLQRGSLRLFVEVINLLDRDNRHSTEDISMITNEPGSPIEVVMAHDEWFPILPSIGVSWTF
jgi:outer membrane receptor protein involved in Fe transport